MKRPQLDLWRSRGPLRRIVDFAYRRIPEDPSGGVIRRTADILECGHQFAIVGVVYGPPTMARRRCRQCATALDQAAVAARLTMAGNPWPLRKIVGPSRLNKDMRSGTYCRTLDPLECGHESPRTDSHSVTKLDLSGKRRRCQRCHWARTEQAEALAVIETDRASRNLVKGDR